MHECIPYENVVSFIVQPTVFVTEGSGTHKCVRHEKSFRFPIQPTSFVKLTLLTLRKNDNQNPELFKEEFTMSVLTDLIYGGSNAVAGLTEGAVNNAIAKYGADKEIAFPDTA